MTSRDDNSELVDLLYDDELDEETAEELRDEIEQSPEARQELERNEAFLERLRDEHEPEEVPGSLHDDIVEAGRRAVEQEASDEEGDEAAAAGGGREDGDGESDSRRGPTDREPRESAGDSSTGIWAGLGETITFRQLSTAAIALLAGGFVLYALRGSLKPDGEADRPETTPSKPTAESVEAEQPPLAEAEAPAKPAKEAPTQQEETSGGPAMADQSETTEKSPAEDDGPAPAGRAKSDSKKPQRQKPAESESSNRRTRRVAKQEDSVDDSTLDLFGGGGGGGGGGAPATESGSTAPSESKKGVDKSDDSKGSAEAPKLAEAEKDEGSKSELQALEAGGDSEATGDSEKIAQKEKAKSDGSTGSAGDKKVAETENGKTKAKTGSAAGAPEETEGGEALEEAFEAGEWTRTVSLANARISDDSLPDVDRARAYELKARALANAGKRSGARETLTELEKMFPNYKPETVAKLKADYDDEPEASDKSGSSDEPDSDINILDSSY